MNYREAYDMHASNGILFNHEIPLRRETFVTRKITRAVAAIHSGLQDMMYLGNLDAQRDWGNARDNVEGMRRIVQQPEAEDYLLGTGEMHSVREFVERAFAQIDHRIVWQGAGFDEVDVDEKSGDVLVRIDPRYLRSTEVEQLLADPSKAHQKLGWRHTTSFEELVKGMVAADLEVVPQERERIERYG